MSIPKNLVLMCWRFARGDADPSEFEKWLYSSPGLEEAFGESLYMAAIETDFRDRDSVFLFRQRISEFARTHQPYACSCIRHPDLSVVDMGNHEDLFSSLVTTRERGDPYWWLFAADCEICAQSWLVASEERHNDVYILRRLSPDKREAILTRNDWPSDFDRFETLLKIGKDAGRSVSYADPLASSLVITVYDLAKARPGIRASELASLLNVSDELVLALVKKVGESSGIEIDVDSRES